MRPAPRFRCPTSEFPIWPRGSPTDSPHVTSVACGHFFISPSMTGVRAASTAFPSFRGFSAQPSRTMSPARGTAERVMNRRVSPPSARRSLLADVRRLRPLGPLGHLERDLVPFLERPEAVPDDRAVVHEHVRPARSMNPKPFASLNHFTFPVSAIVTTSSSGKNLRADRAEQGPQTRHPYRRDPWPGHQEHQIQIREPGRESRRAPEKRVIEHIPEAEHPEPA